MVGRMRFERMTIALKVQLRIINLVILFNLLFYMVAYRARRITTEHSYVA